VAALFLPGDPHLFREQLRPARRYIYGLSMTTDKPVNAGEGGVSPIAFYLDPGSGAPTYRQLVRQAERALLLGYLRRGDQLPRVKDVTASLAINPDTVLKAYRELEHKGIAEGRPGVGTFIVAEPPAPGAREIAELRRSLRQWLTKATGSGLDRDAVGALIEIELHDFHAASAGAVA
jgi:GntR family transcriptional regulator